MNLCGDWRWEFELEMQSLFSHMHFKSICVQFSWLCWGLCWFENELEEVEMNKKCCSATEEWRCLFYSSHQDSGMEILYNVILHFYEWMCCIQFNSLTLGYTATDMAKWIWFISDIIITLMGDKMVVLFSVIL